MTELLLLMVVLGIALLAPLRGADSRDGCDWRAGCRT